MQYVVEGGSDGTRCACHVSKAAAAATSSQQYYSWARTHEMPSLKGPPSSNIMQLFLCAGAGFGRNATGCSMRLIPDSRAKKAVDVSQDYIHDSLAFTLRLTGLYWHFGSFPCIKSVLRFMFRRNCGTSPSTVMHAKGKANYKPQVDSLLTKLI